MDGLILSAHRDQSVGRGLDSLAFKASLGLGLFDFRSRSRFVLGFACLGISPVGLFPLATLSHSVRLPFQVSTC